MSLRRVTAWILLIVCLPVDPKSLEDRLRVACANIIFLEPKLTEWDTLMGDGGEQSLYFCRRKPDSLHLLRLRYHIGDRGSR